MPPAPLGRDTFRGSRSLYLALRDDILLEDTAQKLTVRSVSTGRAIRELDQSEHAFTDLPFFLADDAKRAVLLDNRRQEINVWDVTTGMLIHSKLPKADRVIHQLIGLSADGREAYAILTGIKAGDTYHDLPIEGIHAIRLEDGHVELRVRHLIKFSGYILPPITAHRRIFLDDRAWDLKTGAEVGSYPWKHVDAVSPNGRFAAGFEVEDEIRYRVALWDVQAKKKLGVLPRLAASAGALTFSPDGKLLAVGGRRDWNSEQLPPGRRREPPPLFTGWSPPGRAGRANHIEDRVLLIYDAQTLKRFHTLAFPVYPPDSNEVPDPEVP